MPDMNHLSVIDGAFLHLESPEMPMHVGSLALFEPPAEGTTASWLDAVRSHISQRMHLAPVFTRKLASMPFDLANPVWIHDDDIDLDYHVRHLMLSRPGTLAQLQALAARLHSSLLDRSRPLWEFYVIEGLADGRLGFYSKVHHAAVDGQAAVAMGNSIFDVTVEPRRVRPPRPQRGSRYQLGVAELLAAAVGNQLTQLVQFARLVPPLATTALGLARDAVKQRITRRRADGAPVPVPGGTRWKLAPATPFNVSITNQRAFASLALPLAEIKAIGRHHAASVNDMVLWLCSTALRSYLDAARELPSRSLVAGVPISLRSEGDATSNNQVSGTLVDLGTQEADGLKRLALIQSGTRAMKAQMGLFGSLIPTDFPSFGSPWLLSGLASLYGRSGLAGALRIANVAISNVPGPQVPLYLAGAKMEGIYPLSIVGHGLALNITVQSYRGLLCFGLIACRRAVPDIGELAEEMQRAMVALRKLAPADEAAAAVAATAEPARPDPRVVERAAAAAAAAVPPGPAGRRRPRLKAVAADDAAAPAVVAAKPARDAGPARTTRTTRATPATPAARATPARRA